MTDHKPCGDSPGTQSTPTLVERLRFQQRYTRGLVPVTMHDAANRIEELERENAALIERAATLRAALEPFAKEFERHRAKYETRGEGAVDWFDEMPGEWHTELTVAMTDGRNAIRALSGTHTPKE